MPTADINGIEIHYEIQGEGDPLVLVHGSWTDHTVWGQVAATLSDQFRVISYDRRGHSRSERPDTPRNRRMDEDDLAEIIERLAGGPAHVACSSYGGLTTLGLAARRPELLRTLCVHEPAAITLAPDDDPAVVEARAGLEAVKAQIAAGDIEAGTRRFIEELAMGPGAWDMLPEAVRAIFVGNAPAFAAEQADPHWADLDLDAIAAAGHRLLLTRGTVSPGWLPVATDRLAELLPYAETVVIEGAGHSPHITHPDVYAELVRDFVTERAGVSA